MQPSLFHFRGGAGLEVDLMVQDGLEILLLEAKSDKTLDGSLLDNMRAVLEPLQGAHPGAWLTSALIYGGDQAQVRHGIRILPWDSVAGLAPCPSGQHPGAAESNLPDRTD